MPVADEPRVRLLLDVLRVLDEIDAPYVIIGAFAASLYGITRVTHDIDIVVDLDEQHIQALVARYPSPRYYADPEQMRDSIRLGIMFNLIDSEAGDKADLLPVTMDAFLRQVLARRRRQQVEGPDGRLYDAWVARPDDIIIGKLAAWAEGRSRKHETDIYEMLVFHYLGLDPSQPFDQAAVDQAAADMGQDVIEFWEAAKAAAHQEAQHLADQP